MGPSQLGQAAVEEDHTQVSLPLVVVTVVQPVAEEQVSPREALAAAKAAKEVEPAVAREATVLLP